MNTIFTKISLALLAITATNMASASEFFIKINRAGQHTALLNDQYQTNSSNTYRFFDLPAGTVSLKISDANTGNLVYDGTISLGVDERMVAEMNASGHLSIVTTYKVTYANWYTQNVQEPTNNNNNNSNLNPPPPPPPPAPAGPTAVNNDKFAEIVSAIKSQNVESYKLDKAKSIVKKNLFTSKQVAELCNLFKVESYKLDFAKYAYDYTVDKDNYFNVSKVFKVASYSKELDAYVDAK